MNDQPTPLFDHDCDHCMFLGTYNGYADLYWCMQMGNRPTLIARFSDDGPDYVSGIVFRRTSPELAKAYVLALARGLDVREEDEHPIIRIIGHPNQNN